MAVLLIDGLGADLLRAHAHLAPTLAALAGPVGDLSAPCPSTTPVSLATLGTGMPPGSHGILGFVTAVPGSRAQRGRTARSTTSSGATTPIPTPGRPAGPSSSRPPTPGVAVTAVGPYAYAGSGLTRAVYRGGEVHRGR